MKYLSLKKENENRRERLARMKAGAEIHGRTYEYLKDSGISGRESGRVITNPAAPWLMPQHTGSGGERRDRSMVAHHAGPDFAFCAFFIFQFDVCVFNIFIHCSLLCE